LIKQHKHMIKIQETRTLNVAKAGKALYLYLPKDFCNLYNVEAGDVVKVQLQGFFKRDHVAEWIGKSEGVKQND
jgi:antitoxin component of MazEF toxin-antitoxin module